MLNGLDLFSGIGGLALALSEWVRPVAYLLAATRRPRQPARREGGWGVRLERKWTEEVKDAFDPELYFSIYKKHKYFAMPDRDFCGFCHHGYEFHLRHNIDPEVTP